jgi:D-alanine-D-alanine ligase
MKKPVVAFVTGGYSSEAKVSYESAKTIERQLDRDKFEVHKIDITPSGWFAEADGKRIPIDRNDFSYTGAGGKVCFDVVLIGIHGTPGEDGKLQGYFDLMNLPYTSCDAATSSLTFNKRFTVAVASFAGIRTSRSLHLFRDRPLSPQAILQQLQLPLFVKPSNGGSSIGMSKVKKAEEVAEALDKAFKEDDQVLVEEFIAGREFTVGVYRSRSGITVLPITEIKTKNEFFDFEAKYKPGFTEEVTPAEIPEVLADQIRATARKVFEVFNCRGVVRIDFIYNEAAGEPFLLEINTVPGQSEMSIVPQQVRAAGMKLSDFYTSLIEEALSARRAAHA